MTEIPEQDDGHTAGGVVSYSNPVEYDAVSDATKLAWTIKGITHEVKNAVAAAAERQHMTQGEWLNHHVPLMIQAEVNRAKTPAVVPGQEAAATTVAGPSLSIVDLQIAQQMICSPELEAVPGLKTAKRLVVHQLMAVLGHTPAKKRRVPA